MKVPGPVEVMEELTRRTAEKKRIKRQPSLRLGWGSEIGGLLLLGMGGIVTTVSVLAIAVNWHGLIAFGAAYFGLLLMNEGRKILWN